MDNLASLLPLWENQERCIRWCEDHHLLPSEVACSRCYGRTYLTPASNGDGYVWRCRRKGCQARVSIRNGTIFEYSKLTLPKVLQLIYWWAKDMPVTRAAEEVGVSEGTAIEWFLRFRELCASYLLETAQPIGGIGHTVEIDESKFGTRKYNRGRLRDGVWVFGGIDRATKEIFLVQVEERSAAALVPLIQQYIKHGTTVVSDEWAAYNVLGEYGYNHLTVNHSLNFVDPATGSHTQNVECMWSHAKSKLKRMRGTTREMVGSYLVEYMWRRRFGGPGSTTFHNFLSHTAQLFHLD